MSGSFGKSNSDSQNNSNFNQDVWGGQGGALQNMYGSMGNLFNQTNNQMQGQIPGAIQQQQGVFNDANQNWNNQMQGGAFQGMDLQGMYGDALQGGGNEQFMNEQIMGGAGNDYAQAMQGQLQNQSNERLGQSLASNDARAAGNGMSGSSRHGITESNLYNNANDRLAEQQTNVGYNTFADNQARQMGIAQRADQFDMGRLNNVSGMMGQQQGAMNQGMQNSGNMQNLGMGQFAPSMAPWGAANNYSQNMGSPTVLGSGSGSGGSSSKGKGGSGGK